MPFNLRSSRPKCFYCGHKSAQRIDSTTRQFECEHCLAVNHFDKDGNITDPPANFPDSPAPASLRYARSRPTAPQQPSSDVFCDICLKNQHLYKENLALYLPEPQDPRYPEYLASLPSYKAKLEERYPQVCAECAPRARERIKQAGYVAKTDHIRRMMAGTRAGVVPLRSGAWWRLWVIRMGGIGWWTSAGAQAAWHGVGAIMQKQPSKQSQGVSLASFGLSRCAMQAWQAQESDYVCVTGLAHWIPLLLFIAASTIWWNPQLSDKYLGRRKGRMVGLADYYVYCVVTLLVRGTAWWILRDWRVYTFREDMYKAGHLFMIVFMIVTTGYGYTIVKLDSNPIVSFHISDDQILPGIPEKDPNAPPAPRSLRSTHTSIFQSAPTAPLPQQVVAKAQDRLPPPSVAQQRSTFQPQSTPQRQQPTKSLFSPPSSAGKPSLQDPDEMDWSPSHTANTLAASNFRQRAPPPQPAASFSIGPSPFQSRVPAAPPGRMRHPQAKTVVAPAPPFQKASEAQQRNFFREMAESREQKRKRAAMQQRLWDGSEASTVPTVQGDVDDDDDEHMDMSGGLHGQGAGKGAGSAGDFRLGPQRLFLKSDDRDTGLESMFDEVFRFQDEPGGQAAPEDAPRLKSGAFSFDPNGGTSTVGRGRSDTATRSSGLGLWSAVLFGLVPAVILGMVAVGVKVWRNSLDLEAFGEVKKP